MRTLVLLTACCARIGLFHQNILYLKQFYRISHLLMRNLGVSSSAVHGLHLTSQRSALSLNIIIPSSSIPTFLYSISDEILSIMASSRRLRQESKTSDSTAPLPSIRGRERSTSTCTGNGVGARDANDFQHTMSSTGPNGLEVKVIKVTAKCHLCQFISIRPLAVIASQNTVYRIPCTFDTFPQHHGIIDVVS